LQQATEEKINAFLIRIYYFLSFVRGLFILPNPPIRNIYQSKGRIFMSLIFSAITALISWLIFFQVKTKLDPQSSKIIQPITLLIGTLSSAFFVVATISRFALIIPAGEVGVKETLGKVDSQTLNPGIYLINPLTRVETYSTRIQDIKETVDSTSKEGLGFKLDVSLQYRLNPEQAGVVFQTIGKEEQQQEIIISRFRSLIRQATANYNLVEIYGDKRALISQSLAEAMTEELQPLGFIVEETLLRNILLPENIQIAIQAKVAMEQETQRIELEIIKAKKQAERQLVEARATSDAQKIISEGLTEQIIQLKAIEATQKLAESQNSKIIIIGGGQDKLPLIIPE
jgi:regulator of protease activity HflC (stomatin/prohibitin superfamily)